VNKQFNNQFATQKLRQETSMTNSGGATFTPGTGEQMATNKAFKKKPKKEVKDVEPKLAAGKAKIYMKDKWGWKEAPSIPNRPSKGGFIYKQLFEALNNAVKEYRSGDENIDQLEVDDRVKVTYGNEFYGETGTIVDIIRGFVVVEMDRDGKEYSMHSSDVKKIEDEDDTLDEAYVPDNIKKFAQRKGVTDTVNQIARWAEKAGKKIVGGTAIGKDYNTLILDLTYQGGQIRINIEQGTITLNDELVTNYDEFKAALESDIDEVFSQKDYDRVKVVLSKIRDKNSKLYNAIIDALSDIYPHDLDKEFGSDIQAAGLNENYSRFKNETKTRGKADQFHQAVRQVRQKVQEINRLFEYVSRLKQELSEGEGGLKYRMHTEKALAKIKDMVNELNKNVKKFK
jgi:hypothetical protein